MNMQNDCHFISMQFRERLAHKFWCSAYVALQIFHAVFVDLCWISLFFFSLSLWSDNKNQIHFFTQKRIAVEPEKHEDGLDKDGNEAGEVSLLSQPPKLHEPTMMSVVKNSKIIVWTRPFMKWPNSKCHAGHKCMTHFDKFLDWTLVEDLFNG